MNLQEVSTNNLMIDVDWGKPVHKEYGKGKVQTIIGIGAAFSGAGDTDETDGYDDIG